VFFQSTRIVLVYNSQMFIIQWSCIQSGYSPTSFSCNSHNYLRLSKTIWNSRNCSVINIINEFRALNLLRWQFLCMCNIFANKSKLCRIYPTSVAWDFLKRAKFTLRYYIHRKTVRTASGAAVEIYTTNFFIKTNSRMCSPVGFSCHIPPLFVTTC
jgi:hypothetical protein